MDHLTTPHANWNGEKGDSAPLIEALVASILDSKHPLSAEDLSVFEGFLDDPDLAPEQRREFLQTVWNIVVCIIDYQWDVARFAPTKSACESKEKGTEFLAIETPDMIQLKDTKCTKTYNKAASKAAGRKGSP